MVEMGPVYLGVRSGAVEIRDINGVVCKVHKSKEGCSV